VITQGDTPFVRDAQRPPAADGDDPRAGKEMPVQGRTGRAGQRQWAGTGAMRVLVSHAER
jgi:hypothetical protein